jgi:YbbR domain-containing protein
MLSRLRDNLLLKIISLVASILLWCYVQAERPPNIARTVAARVTPQNQPSGVDVEDLPSKILVTISGPAPNVERIKDMDIQAVADLHTLSTDHPGTTLVNVNLILPEYARGISFEQPPPIKAQVQPQQQNQMAVIPLYPKEPPAGFHYASPVVRPAFVKVTGLQEQLNQVDRIIVNAAPPTTGASIDGDFPVLALDKDKNVVSDIKVTPDKVHVSVQLVEEPASKIVTVSPSIVDQPLPPHILKSITVKPNQVRITGRLERLNQIFTLPTEDIFIHNMTQDSQVAANLQIEPDLTVYSLDGRQIRSVTILVSIGKLGPTSVPPPQTPPDSSETARP